MNHTTYYCCAAHLLESIKCLKVNYNKKVTEIQRNPRYFGGPYDCEFEECHEPAEFRLIVKSMMLPEKVEFT
jgi:hypothetical protein